MTDSKFKTIKRQHEPGDFHELTFSVYRRMRLLTNDAWRRELASTVENACLAEAMELVAFVFMPDHVHLLVFPRNTKPDMAGFLAKVKQPFSASIRRVLESQQSRLLSQLTVRERPGKHVFRFWQEGPGYDRNLFRPRSILSAIDYLHRNPVRAELCQRAVDWKWSSARYYLSHPCKQQDPDLPHIHGLHPEALDPGSSRP